jgi:hypothetical protein
MFFLVILIFLSIAVGGFHGTVFFNYGNQDGQVPSSGTVKGSLIWCFIYLILWNFAVLFNYSFSIKLILLFSYFNFNICWTWIFWRTVFQRNIDQTRNYVIHAEEHHMHF